MQNTNTNTNNTNNNNYLDPNIWGPHFWFVLFTMAISYPIHPNDVAKKKYYEFIMNLPIFLPQSSIGIGINFSKLIDLFPVTPYLDGRASFLKWVNFIHNRVNVSLNKEQVTLHDALEIYYNHYKPPLERVKEKYKHLEKVAFFIIICSFLLFIKYKGDL